MDTQTTPSVFDIDIGKDPDDTCVATMVGLNLERFNPALIITNDESQTLGRAKFLTQIINSTGANIPVGAGLPSTAKREDTLVERAGIVSEGEKNFMSDGFSYLLHVLDSNDRVNYFGLGALTNLATALDEFPEFAERVNLVQMGPSFQGAYRKPAPQYNVRIDIPSFRKVIAQVDEPRFLMSHASWGSYGEKGTRQQLGIYVDDPVWKALRDDPNPARNLFAEHLMAWKDDGKPCSIMHDPLTVLSFYESLVDYVDGEMLFDEIGFTDLTERSKAEIRSLDDHRLTKLSDYLDTPTQERAGLIKKVRFSLNTDYDSARYSIVRALFGEARPDLANQWKEYNSQRSE